MPSVLGELSVLVPGDEKTPMFAHMYKNKVVPLMYAKLVKWLKLWVQCSDTNLDGYTVHCLRRWGVTHALESDIQREAIKIFGDWASDAYKRYICNRSWAICISPRAMGFG